MTDEDDILLADGFEAAYLGVCRRFNTYAALYDYDQCVAVLMERDEMSYEDAVEFLEFNVLGAYVGESTPVFLLPRSDEEGELEARYGVDSPYRMVSQSETVEQAEKDNSAETETQTPAGLFGEDLED